MTKRWTLMALLLIALAALVGCSDDPVDPTPTANTFETMAAAVEAYLNDNADCPGTITAQSLHDNLDDYTVVDIRSADAYSAGHIPGAYNSSLATILTDVGTTIPTDKTIVIACYSGQSAGHAKIALELMGHEDVKTLGFGMSSWNSSLAAGWNDNIGDNLPSPETTNNNAGLTEHEFPTLPGTNATIVATRVAAMLAGGFQSISWATLQPNLDDYFVVNYFGQADYEGTGTAGVPGHIPGAYQFTPYASLGFEQMLKNLPSDGTTIVVYCWTGQHSSQVVAALNMLGYNAKSLSYGSNHLFHSSLTANRWTAESTHDFDLEVGDGSATPFETMAAAVEAYLNDNADCPGVITAQTLHDNPDDYTVVDIRSADAYMAGHIPGAYNSSLATILTDVGTTIPTDKTIVIACYSGQSAGHAKIALELMGFEDVKTLGFGMSSWNSSLATGWNNNIGDNLPSPETTNNNAGLIEHEFPTLTGDNATIVATRVAAMLAGGFQSISWATLQPNLEDYFIVNYFGQADYEGTGTAGVPGHIPGAYQFTPYASLGFEQMLKNLPSDGTPIVVYCWTGQHSSQVVAALNMLGYNAKSLSYGSNHLFHSSLTANRWTAAATHDFELEVGGPQTPEFAAVYAAVDAYLNDNADSPGVILAQALYDNLDDYTVIDIRSATDYGAGHITGAYNSSLATLLNDLDGTIPDDKPYVITCYTGQSAGHAKVAMELMGYEDVKSLKWGMCSWNSTLASRWTDSVGDNLPAAETTNNNGSLVVHAYPTLTDGDTVEDRVAAMLAAGFQSVTWTVPTPPDLTPYFIVNYFGVADYEGTGSNGVPGHIPGAFQFTPYTSLKVGEMLPYLPSDGTPILVYCWTGQTSSQVVAALNMLGYNAKSLSFGSNRLFHSSLTANKWTIAETHAFPLSTAVPAAI